LLQALWGHRGEGLILSEGLERPSPGELKLKTEQDFSRLREGRGGASQTGGAESNVQPEHE